MKFKKLFNPAYRKHLLLRVKELLKVRETLIIIIISSVSLNIGLIWITFPYLKTNVLGLKDSETPSQAFQPVKIKISTAKIAPMARKITVTGTTKAIDIVPIMSEVSGKISQINFKQGEFVKKGTLLIQLDDRQALAELSDARARLKQAQAQYTRQKVLLDKKYGSLSILEKAEADLASAQAYVEKAQVQLQHTQILAPFDGEIGLRNVSVGGHVDPNREITRLVRSNPLEVDFQVPESDVTKIFEDQEVDVLVEGFDILPIQGKITAIEPYSDPVAHTIRIRAQIDNPDNKIRDGAFARITIPLSKSDNAIVVPQSAATKEGDQDVVFVISQGRALRRGVIIGAQENGLVEIVDGLSVGEEVAIDPVEYLVDGIPISVDTSE